MYVYFTRFVKKHMNNELPEQFEVQTLLVNQLMLQSCHSSSTALSMYMYIDTGCAKVSIDACLFMYICAKACICVSVCLRELTGGPSMPDSPCMPCFPWGPCRGQREV